MTDLLALSDVLVIRAMERSYTKALDGSVRATLAGNNVPRHRAYEEIQIPAARHSRALDGAWGILPELTVSWDLPISPADWIAALDGYTRQLLTSRRPRSLDDLERALTRVGARRAG